MDSLLSRLVLSDRPAYRISRHACFWLSCILFFGTIYGSYWHFGQNPPIFNKHAFAEAIFYLPLHMFLGYAIIYGLMPRYLKQEKYLHLLAAVLVLILVTSFFSYLISLYVINPYRAWQELPVSPKILPNSLMAGLRGSNTVAGFMVAIKLLKNGHFRKLEIEQLEKARLKAELELLKGQLHPHFLFNTLNNLYALVIQKSENSPKVILMLSDLLQYMLTESKQHRIPLNRELAMMEHYINLEQLRYGNRLDLNINMKQGEEQLQIAPLILLPFVENAFKHGVHEMIEQPWISVDCAVSNNSLKLKLINSKPNLRDRIRHSTKIGLANVQKRLELMYRDKFQLKVLDEGESYVVNLSLELERA
ncbi:MAG: histidine kinase [Cyclobacteriaceae bacterium]|nr:histidine kinase [Cyclobacteriaceae bacterium]